MPLGQIAHAMSAHSGTEPLDFSQVEANLSGTDSDDFSVNTPLILLSVPLAALV